jgi:hypothetical protein
MSGMDNLAYRYIIKYVSEHGKEPIHEHFYSKVGADRQLKKILAMGLCAWMTVEPIDYWDDDDIPF